MPSRKQRRRRAKERRHDYEYVYVDAEGQEVEVDPDEVQDGRKQPKDKRPQPAARGGRQIQPASWNRVAKRALLFGPLMFLTIRLLEHKEAITASLVRTFFLLLLFLPFSYVMDTMLYRSHLRRTRRRS